MKTLTKKKTRTKRRRKATKAQLIASKQRIDEAWLKKYSLETLEDRENQFIRMTSRATYRKVLKEKKRKSRR